MTETDVAWSRYSITTQDDEHVTVHWETNDDRDWGVPTEHAQDDYEFGGADALDRALKHTGKSRQGIGQRVYVTLDGEAI